MDRGEGAPVKTPVHSRQFTGVDGSDPPHTRTVYALTISANGTDTGPVIWVPYTRKYTGTVRSPNSDVRYEGNRPFICQS